MQMVPELGKHLKSNARDLNGHGKINIEVTNDVALQVKSMGVDMDVNRMHASWEHWEEA